MGVAGWIVLAFVLGLVFGRLTAGKTRGGMAPAAAPTTPGFPSTATPANGQRMQTSVATTVDVPVSLSASDSSALLADLQGAYTVMLLDHGPNIINTVKAIRDVAHVDLKTAKDLTDNTPCELMKVGSLEEGKRVIQRFQGVASIRLEGGSAATLSPELQHLLEEFAQKTAANVTRTT